MPDLRAVRAFLDRAHLSLAEEAAAVIADEVAPLEEPADDDAARDQALDLLGILGDADLLRVIDPLELRGCCIVREVLGHASPLADAVFALQALGTVPIALAGSDELRERWVGPALAGEAMGAFAMTEAEAGSDVAAIGTTARRDGDGYVLEGEKTFISNAGIADFYTVFACTAPEEGRRRERACRPGNLTFDRNVVIRGPKASRQASSIQPARLADAHDGGGEGGSPRRQSRGPDLTCGLALNYIV
jgi:acyl-CoA dehydrogenase